jgi:hypothetical protein
VIELQVYKYNDPDTYLGVLPVRFQPQFLSQLKATGSGSFIIPLDRAQLNWPLLEYRNLVKIAIDGAVIGGFLIGKQKAATIGDGEKKEEVIEVMGEGFKVLFDDATVKPENGLFAQSGDTRSFNFASKEDDWYNPSDWIAPTVVATAHATGNIWGKYPTDFPAGTGAQWIWVGPISPAPPPTTCYFRYTITVVSTGTYAIYAACDNYLSIWCDGELLATSGEGKDWSTWHKATKVNVTLTPGTHVIAFTGANAVHAGGNPAALVMALMKVDGDIETFVGRSGTGNWKCLAYPSSAPGWTPGNVILQLLEEATARGIYFPTWFEPTFTSVLDSDGNPWPKSLDWTFDVEESYLSVINKLEETGLDIWMDASTMELHAVPQRGINRTVFPTTEQAPVVNIATNPSFETASGTTTTPGGATVPALPNIASVATGRVSWQAAAAAYEGSFGMRTEITQANVAVGIQITNNTVTTGVTGTIAMRVRPNNRTMVVTPRIRGTSGSPVTCPVGVWTEVRGEIVAGGASSASTGLIIASNAGHQVGDTIDVDTGCLVVGSYGGPIFNGDSPDTTTLINIGWNGTPHASGSTATPLMQDVTGDAPIIFQRGQNLKLAELEGSGKIKNALGIRTEAGWQEEEDAASIALYGRIEGKLDTNASAAVSTSLAQVIFSQRATPEEGASYEVIIDNRTVPFIHFNIGDWVLAPNKDDQLVPRRVVSIAVEETETGQPHYTLEFDTIFQTYEEKIANFVNKSTGGGAGAGLSNSSTTPPSGGGPIIIPPAPVPLTTPAAPTALNATSTGTWSANGVYPTSKVTLSWTAVTLNTNGTNATINEYEVWGYPTLLGAAGDRHLATVTGTTAEIDGLTPAEGWTFRVRAIDSAGTPGEWSSNLAHTPVGPTTPMLAPVAPTLATELGLLVVSWTGKLNNAGAPVDPPNQFRYAYASVATSSGGTYTRMGPAFPRGGGSITIPGLVIGTQYWVKLTAVDGIGIESPASTAGGPITISGVALGDLDASIGAAIDAAEEAALDAREVTNMLNDPSFELNTEEWWDLLDAKATFSTVSPRTGTRALRMVAHTTPTRYVNYTRPIQIEEGDSVYLSAWIREITNGAGIDGAVALGVDYGATEALGSSIDVVLSPDTTTSYREFGDNWLAPAGTRFIRPYIKMIDNDNTTLYHLDDIRLRLMTSTTTIVDGAIVAEKIGAEAVIAGKIAANAVTAVTIQAGAITAEKMAADSVTANSIAAGSIEADHIVAGAIQTSHLSPSVGQELDITANESINLVVGQMDVLTGDVNDNQQNLEAMQTYYTFGVDGAVVSTPASPFAVAIRNDRIEMLENGNVVSYWNSGQMVVAQLVGEKVILGNHQLEKYDDGTVVRALG